MATRTMLVAGMSRQRKRRGGFKYGVSLPSFFMTPKLIGPARRPREIQPIVEHFFLEKPKEEIHNGIVFPRPKWERDKPLGHFFKENPYALKRLRDEAANSLQIEASSSVEEAELVEGEQSEEEIASPIEAQGKEEEEREVEEHKVPPIEIPEGGFLPLWNLPDNPGARKKPKRVGRGIGSGKGKTCGRGQKGQKARRGHKPKLGFEGGQTPLRLRLPKKFGPKNPLDMKFKEVTLERIKEFIQKGKIDPSKLITMKTLHDTRCSGKYIQDGVLLLGQGHTKFDTPIHIEVSRCSLTAKLAIEQAGGSVRKVHYNKLGMRALIDPLWFKKKGRLLPKNARPKPKIAPLVDAIGRLPAPESPILPEGFVLKAPVYGHPWPPEGSSAKTDSNESKEDGSTKAETKQSGDTGKAETKEGDS